MAASLYLLKREAGRWEFRPSPLYGRAMAIAFAAGSAFLIYLASLFFRHPATPRFGAILIPAAAYSAGLGIRAWRTRDTPLILDTAGRVSYGERELCAPGTVRSVRIAVSKSGEAGDYEICFELDSGTLIATPSQYFAGFRSAEQARPFARELAEALGVPVSESA